MGKTRTVESLIQGAIREATQGRVMAAPSAAVEEAAQVVINQTNNEPWFQSRVTLGSSGVILVSVGRILGAVGAGNVDLVAMTPDIVVIVGALVALYGRWKAKKPLGA